MSTLATDRLYDETQTAQPRCAGGRKNCGLERRGKVYHLTELFPLAVGDDLNVVVKYQAADISDTARVFQENSTVIKALVQSFLNFARLLRER